MLCAVRTPFYNNIQPYNLAYKNELTTKIVCRAYGHHRDLVFYFRVCHLA
jgi:hypothetical protein